jgi:hypothetical protein
VTAPLTVESLILALDELARAGVPLTARVCVQVYDGAGDGMPCAETLIDVVTTNNLQNVVILTPHWKMGQHYSKMPSTNKN